MQLDLRVSITGGVHFDLVKRVLRDINRSGQAPEEIIQQAGIPADPLPIDVSSVCVCLCANEGWCRPAAHQLPIQPGSAAVPLAASQLTFHRAICCPACLQISDTVYPMYKAFIEPDLKAAHLRIYNTFNPFSGFMSPTYILKSAKRVSEAEVCAVMQVRRLRHAAAAGWGDLLGAGLSAGQRWAERRARGALRCTFSAFLLLHGH